MTGIYVQDIPILDDMTTIVHTLNVAKVGPGNASARHTSLGTPEQEDYRKSCAVHTHQQKASSKDAPDYSKETHFKPHCCG